LAEPILADHRLPQGGATVAVLRAWVAELLAAAATLTLVAVAGATLAIAFASVGLAAAIAAWTLYRDAPVLCLSRGVAPGVPMLPPAFACGFGQSGLTKESGKHGDDRAAAGGRDGPGELVESVAIHETPHMRSTQFGADRRAEQHPASA
jgi:hypothetical protein